MGNYAEPGAAASEMTALRGLLALAAVCGVLAIYIGALTALGVKELWAGFLFLLCWASFGHAAPDKLFSCVLGAAFGLLLAWTLRLFPAWFGGMGLWVFLGLVLVVVYLQIMQWAKTVVNPPAMLYLTVGAIAEVNTQTRFMAAYAALMLAVVYFGGLAAAVRLVHQRR